MGFFTHLEQSPYCYKNYAVFCDKQGRDVCQCGWVGEKQKPMVRGRTLKEIMAEKDQEDPEEDWDTYVSDPR